MNYATDADGHIVLDDVTKQFGDVTAVDHVSLTIGKGEFFSLLGPSGCGKTTTLRMIAGFEEPTSGRILLAGRGRHVRPGREAPRQHGLPGVRAVPAHVRAGEHRVRPQDQEG